MIVIRYFAWLLVYQVVTFYKQTPWSFLLGIAIWPYYVTTRFVHPVEYHKDIVSNGIKGLKKYWGTEGAVVPPSFVVRRVEALELEALR